MEKSQEDSGECDEGVRTYVPMMGDAVEVEDKDDVAPTWTYGVVEEFRSGLGWCVYHPQTKRKRLVPASALRPATWPGQQAGATSGPGVPPRRRKSLVSGPATWWQEASLMVETAKSGRSSCGGCGGRIAETKLRVGMKTRISRGRYYSRKEWFHLRTACLEIDRRCVVSRVDCFDGHLDLDASDRDKLSRFVARDLNSKTRRTTNKKRTTSKALSAKSTREDTERAGAGAGARNGPQEKFSRACRIVVAQFVAEFKQGVFDKDGRPKKMVELEVKPTESAEVEATTTVTLAGDSDSDDDSHALRGEESQREEEEKASVVVICPVTQREIDWADCHVHHADPNTFDQLVRGFARERRLDVSAVRYHLGSFIDQRLAHDFYDYHAARCQLQVVHKDANMGLLKRKRPPEHTQENENENENEGEGRGEAGRNDEEGEGVKDEESVGKRQKREEAKNTMYEEIICKVSSEQNDWAEEDKEDQWTERLGDMWARLKKKTNHKCGRTKSVVGGVILRLLRKRKSADVGPQTCDDCGIERAKITRLPTARKSVCYECRIKTYASKQWARKDYSLSERDLLTIEPEIVPNPLSPNFADMKLYRRSDLLALAHAKHGPGFSVPLR